MLTGGSLIVSAELSIMKHLTLEVIRISLWPIYRKKLYFEYILPKVANKRHSLMLSISHISQAIWRRFLFHSSCFTLSHVIFLPSTKSSVQKLHSDLIETRSLFDFFGTWFILTVRRVGFKIDDLERSMIDSLKVTLQLGRLRISIWAPSYLLLIFLCLSQEVEFL